MQTYEWHQVVYAEINNTNNLTASKTWLWTTDTTFYISRLIHNLTLGCLVCSDERAVAFHTVSQVWFPVSHCVMAMVAKWDRMFFPGFGIHLGFPPIKATFPAKQNIVYEWKLCGSSCLSSVYACTLEHILKSKTQKHKENFLTPCTWLAGIPMSSRAVRKKEGAGFPTTSAVTSQAY